MKPGTTKVGASSSIYRRNGKSPGASIGNIKKHASFIRHGHARTYSKSIRDTCTKELLPVEAGLIRLPETGTKQELPSLAKAIIHLGNPSDRPSWPGGVARSAGVVDQSHYRIEPPSNPVGLGYIVFGISDIRVAGETLFAL
jgi:hypothetical protein